MSDLEPKGEWPDGPWEWKGYYLQQVGYDNPYETPAGGPIWEDGSAGGEYAGCDTESPQARLFAVAPELYDAAREFINWWVEEGQHSFDGAPASLFRLRHAMALARGEKDSPLATDWNTQGESHAG